VDALQTLLPLAALAVGLLFWAYCLVDFTRTPASEVRSLPQVLWLAILVFGSVVGALAWWFLGRPQRPTRP
jgi:hypothetical protein